MVDYADGRNMRVGGSSQANIKSRANYVDKHAKSTGFPPEEMRSRLHKHLLWKCLARRLCFAGFASRSDDMPCAQNQVRRHQAKQRPQLRYTRPKVSNETSETLGIIIDQNPQIMDAAAAQQSSAASQLSSGETTAEQLEVLPTQAPTPRHQGPLEVRFEDREFEMGSGATERANPLSGVSIEYDLGIGLFNNGRRSNWLPLGSATKMIRDNTLDLRNILEQLSQVD
ncbi:hypothetical protein N0V93_004710 [Gnomoniopsis smithogilvyi]|uniref:Uncharacterized protein n=1 Tax=Gnomoniopsis smithogilvyi TaxID=1191159 RepID=A0A9W8YT55_9PEZI|nr:hypothetical protein N0V93_004710 [Gnomoniopsis smithogilvyi]